jgi:hypothetical protein
MTLLETRQNDSRTERLRFSQRESYALAVSLETKVFRSLTPQELHSCGLGEVRGLLRRGIQSDLVHTNHWYFPLQCTKTCDTCLE